MLQGKTRWYPPYVPFEKKSVFCMTKAQTHEVYGLSDCGVDARTLGEVDFPNDEWQKCFAEVPRRGSKVKCRVVRTEFWPRFYTLFTSVYQEPPSNYGMEVTKAFARGFLHENIKGPVNWALFAEDMISAMDASKLQAKKNRWAVFHGSFAAHNSRSRQGPKIERSEVGHEQGPETPLLSLQDMKKNMYFSLESLTELDRMHEAVEARHAIALLEINEARRKVDLHKADMHREEGAQLLVDSLRRQLQDAEAEVQEAEKGPDAQDAGKLQVLRSRVDRLTLTIHTLAGVVVDSVPDGARSAALEQLELAQQRKRWCVHIWTLSKACRPKGVKFCYVCLHPNCHLLIWAPQIRVAFVVLVDWSCTTRMVLACLCYLVLMCTIFTVLLTLLQARRLAWVWDACKPSHLLRGLWRCLPILVPQVMEWSHELHQHLCC